MRKKPSKASSAERSNDLHHAELECKRVLLHQTLLNSIFGTRMPGTTWDWNVDDLLIIGAANCVLGVNREDLHENAGNRPELSTRVPSKHSELSTSLSKCQVFHTSALFFNFFVRSKVMVLNLPVEETKMSQT